MSRKTGQAGIELIKKFEGCKLTAYRCSAGILTIGYGHTAGVREGQTISADESMFLLKQDLQKFESYVNNPSYVPFTGSLNQSQFDALVSFAFNLGAGNLRKLCRTRSISEIPIGMVLYNKANGKELAGLTRRRKAEVALFTSEESEDYEMPLIKKGSKGTAVKLWQCFLGIETDGIFGDATDRATRKWQACVGLDADGKVGDNTWRCAFNSL